MSVKPALPLRPDERPVYVLVIGSDISNHDADRIQGAITEALRTTEETERGFCGRCGAEIARASWRLPWTASGAYDPVWCVVDGVWQAHKPKEADHASA
jgi:hypothetical protein